MLSIDNNFDKIQYFRGQVTCVALFARLTLWRKNAGEGFNCTTKNLQSKEYVCHDVRPILIIGARQKCFQYGTYERTCDALASKQSKSHAVH